ncbi:MAG: class I SAM-dependent methyltransferase [Deltaproteobacteria bacterium]|nr:class I SAM-dependent methyltransferase [Deltaproteobacteria bacterium]
MNPLLHILVPQLAKPHGLLARLAGPMLDRGNHVINLHTVAALDLQPRDRVLELGFGGGAALAMALAHEPAITLSGIEPSPEMVKRSAARFGAKVRLTVGSVEAIGADDGAFDTVFGVNVVYFWPDLDVALAEIRRVLAPRGKLVLGVRPRAALERLDFGSAGHRVWDATQYVEALRAARFVDVEARRVPDPNGAVVITARRDGP